MSTHSSSSIGIGNGPCWPSVLGNMPIGQGAPACPRYTWNLACQNIFHAAITSHHQGNHLPALGRNHQRSNQSTVAAYGKVDFGATPESTWCKTKDFQSNQSICVYMFTDQGALPSPRQSKGIHPCVVAILGCSCWRSGRYETMICRHMILQPFCVTRVEVVRPRLPHSPH